MNDQVLGNKAIKTRIDNLTVTGSHEMHLLVLSSIAHRICEHGDSEGARYYSIALKAGMVGKPAGLTAKSFATELKRIGGKLQQDDKGNITLSGIKKGAELNVEFYKDSAPKKAAPKTNAEKFTTAVENAAKNGITLDDMMEIIAAHFDVEVSTSDEVSDEIASLQEAVAACKAA